MMPHTPYWNPSRLARLHLLAFVIAVVAPFSAHADLLTEARDRRANSEHAKAAELFQRHLDSTDPSAAVYLELGQAHSAAGQSDRAALAFHRALLLDPSFTPARNDLDQVNRALGIPKAPLRRVDEIASLVPLDTLAVAAAAVFWSGAFLLLVTFFQAKRFLFSVFAGAMVLMGAVGLFVSGTTDPRFVDARAVMVMGDAGMPFYRTPTDDPAGKITTLSPGSVVHVLGTSGRWFHGELPGGQAGWFLQEGTEPLIPSQSSATSQPGS